MRTHEYRMKAQARNGPAPRNTGKAQAFSKPSPAIRNILYGPAVQPKLRIGPADDKYEREADRVAEQVMRMPDEPVQCEAMPEEEEEELLQAKMDGRRSPPVTPGLHAAINPVRRGGRPLPIATRRFLEPRFGTDFRQVRIHTDDAADRAARSINARAFALGPHIAFRAGQYSPETRAGRLLLSHELTHVLQQGTRLQPLIQRDDDEPGTDFPSSGGTDHLARLVSGILRDQLSDSSMRGHLSSLGSALQGLAVESTSEGGSQPSTSGHRLAALNIEAAFERTSRDIIADPSFRALRQRLIQIVGSSDLSAMITALAAGLALILADIPVEGSPSQDLGAGFSVGGSFDLGTIQSLQFNNLSAYAQYASEYFQSRLGGSVSRDADTEEYSGSGSGQVRFGTNISHILARVSINSDGEVTLAGDLSGGLSFGGNSQLVFRTGLSHSFATGETIFSPGVSGRFNFGRDQSLSLGTQLNISTEDDLTGLTGFIEYRRNLLHLRLEGNMGGIPDAESIAPGADNRVQLRVTIPIPVSSPF